MAELSLNVSNSSVPDVQLDCGRFPPIFLSVVHVLTYVTGQPIVFKLLWICLTSLKTPDVLNSNLAVFHNVQYLISVVHLFIIFLAPEMQVNVLTFLFIYVQVGGPMSLSFICMQRFVAVVRPLSYHLLKKYSYSKVCSAAVWLVSLPNAFLFTFAKNRISPVTQKIVLFFPSFVMILMTTLVMHSSLVIVRTLRRPNSVGDKSVPAKKKAYYAMRSMLFIAMFFYMPVHLMQRITADNEYLHNCITTPVCMFLLSAASVVHPIVFLCSQGKFFTRLGWKRKCSLK